MKTNDIKYAFLKLYKKYNFENFIKYEYFEIKLENDMELYEKKIMI